MDSDAIDIRRSNFVVKAMKKIGTNTGSGTSNTPENREGLK